MSDACTLITVYTSGFGETAPALPLLFLSLSLSSSHTSHMQYLRYFAKISWGLYSRGESEGIVKTAVTARQTVPLPPLRPKGDDVRTEM